MSAVPTRRLPPGKPPEVLRDPAVVAGYLEDASGSPPGHARGLVRLRSESEAAALLADPAGPSHLLFQAARTSLTGGATPRGEVVVSVERMGEMRSPTRHPGGARAAVQPGVRLNDLQRWLARENLYYPPVPTYLEAMLGGSVSTNAGGAATFKYGVTRDWVHGLRVLLFNGELLSIERGQAVARPGETFAIRLHDGTELRVPVPDYRLPEVRKISAGYYASDPMDLVDLFVGSEGTLGLISEITIDLVPLPPALVTVLAPTDDWRAALRLAAALRRTALRVRSGAEPRGPDVRSIELMDRRCLDVLRESGEDRRLRIALPPDTHAALLLEVELPEPLSDTRALDLLSAFVEGRTAAEHPLVGLSAILRDHGALDRVEMAFPEDGSRRAELNALREAVPLKIGEMLARRDATGAATEKVAGDPIVPFGELETMIEFYERGFRERGLEFAIWGHLSDGNLHPNALPRSAAEAETARQLQLEFATEAVRRGGAPLSEHGVGRSPIKQEMLRRFLGDGAIESMRRVKRVLDPAGRFSPGVLFPPLSGVSIL